MADEIKKVEFDPKVKVTETIDLGIDGVTNSDSIQQIAGLSGSLSPSTTVPATKVYKDQVALTAGAKTLDLELLVRANLPDVVGTGLKVQLFVFSNPSTNTGAMTIVDGAANGYNIFGSAAGSNTVMIGGSIMIFGNDNLDDIASADSEIDITGTGTESFEVLIVMG